MKDQNSQNINLVNPLNPKEILRTETLIAKNKQNNVEEQNIEVEHHEVPKKEKAKKGSNLILLTILTLIFAALGIGYYVIVSNNKQNNPPVNNNQNEQPNEPEITKVSLQNISDIFNQNIVNYKVADNTITTSQSFGDRIKVSVNLTESTLNYEFTITDRTLSTVMANEDAIGYNVTVYMLSSIAKYHGVNFIDSVTYLTNNLANLNNVNNIEVIDFGQVKQISINLDEIMEIK